MKKVLKYSKNRRKYLNSLPKIYLIGRWARYGVREFPFSGKYEKDDKGRDIPLVYDYRDFNGTCDEYYLTKITNVTTGQILCWTLVKDIALYIAKTMNETLV